MELNSSYHSAIFGKILDHYYKNNTFKINH
jgi:hypothetical protein